MTKDHIVPKSKGGKDMLSNTQTMCVICNTKKGDTLWV
jgi:5-methylcytosine-specific restriction endonuclease McrA